MKGGLISQTLAASGGSGTANASLFSAIASLPVVAESVLKIDNVPTAYSIKVLCAGPDTLGFGTVGTDDYYDYDGDPYDPPGIIDRYNLYYSALCMGDEIIYIPSASPSQSVPVHYELRVTAGLYGGGKKHYKSYEKIYTYSFTNAKLSFYGNYMYINYDVNYDLQVISYSCDSFGNITLNPDSSYTESGGYSGVPHGKYQIIANNNSDVNYFIHGYKTEAIIREKWLSFCNTMSGGEITCQQKQ